MKKKTILKLLTTILLFSVFMMQNVLADTGFGPAEIYCYNKKNNMILGTASLINGNNESKYGVFSLITPYTNKDTWQTVPSEIIHARVLCLNCLKEMQRTDAIPGYTYGDTLSGQCIHCGSNNLRFFMPIPRDEFINLWVEGAGNFNLEKTNVPFTWITSERIPPNSACNVNIMFDPSNSFIPDNFNKHWEFHLRGSTLLSKESIGGGQQVVSGIDLRILMSFKFPIYIEIVSPIKKGENFTIRVTYGDNTESWGIVPPEGTKVTFNGETKTIDENGYITFMFPDTRGDYEYSLSAESNELYEPTTLMISTNMPEPGDTVEINNGGSKSFISFENIFFVGILFFIIILIIVGIIWKIKNTKKQKKSPW